MKLLVENMPLLLIGLRNTVVLAGATLVLSTALGIVFGLGRHNRFVAVQVISRAYVELFRDLPLIVTVLGVFFAAPLVGLSLDSFSAATLGISLWAGANCAEIVRGALASVGRDQEEAARALGLSTSEAMRFIVAPQALRPFIPPYTGLVMIIVQASSLGALVGFAELLRMGEIIIERTAVTRGGSPAFLIYGTILAVYFVICRLLSISMSRLEQSRRIVAVQAGGPAAGAAAGHDVIQMG